MPLLEDLTIAKNQFTNIDVSNCPKLYRFYAFENNINHHLDFTNNPELWWLNVADNPIPSMDVSQCPELYTFRAYNTLLYNLDFTNNPMLEDINIYNVLNLEWVDLRNGNNDIVDFYSYNTPNFTCLFVDDVASGDGDFNVDDNVNIVNNEAECEALGILDNNLQSLVHIFPNPVKEVLIIKNSKTIVLKEVKIYDIAGKLLQADTNNLNRLNVSNLSSGILFIQLETEQGVLVKKVLKE